MNSIYKRKDYNVYENPEIPWELFLLNSENFDEKVFISISSSSVISSFFLYNKHQKTILLFKLVNLNNTSKYYKMGHKYLKTKIFNIFRENYFIPDTEDELLQYLTKIRFDEKYISTK